MENVQSAVIIKAGGFVLLRRIRPQHREEEEERKKALNTVFDCDTAAALTSQPPDKFAKCVSIKHDPAARQLSLQDCIISAAGVDPVCQPLSVLPADGGREDVKVCLHRQIIIPRKHAICRVGGRSFHKQTPPGCQGRTSVTCASEGIKASLLSPGGAVVFCPATGRWRQVEGSAIQRRRRLDLLALFTRRKSVSVTMPEEARRPNRFHPQIPRPRGLHDK